jgi:hypothetical protein
MPTVSPFPQWLRQQASRDDPVGAMARVMIGLEQRRGQPFHDLVSFYVRLKHDGAPISTRCLDIAMCEWRSLALPIRRTRSRLPNPLNDARDALSQV